ncbi:MAG: hypothetical protein E6X34_00025 [Clostridium sp.]|uniref:hypothetical protein n=1 Tax=Clostridium sp. TaxID=1506 RepID=UPI002915B6E1|nr:hypothetical protein [Clostridium sp.]MDU4936819.1 hypothetical protein [Clostridium sp.]
MNYITPFNNYIVVAPSGDVTGFVELSDARGYITTNYLERILSIAHEGKYSYFDMTQERDMEDSGIMAGVYEGEAQIYDLDEFIEKIRNSAMFQDEKDELISKLLQKEIDMNVKEYLIEGILTEVEQKWTI